MYGLVYICLRRHAILSRSRRVLHPDVKWQRECLQFLKHLTVCEHWVRKEGQLHFRTVWFVIFFMLQVLKASMFWSEVWIAWDRSVLEWVCKFQGILDCAPCRPWLGKGSKLSEGTWHWTFGTVINSLTNLIQVESWRLLCCWFLKSPNVTFTYLCITGPGEGPRKPGWWRHARWAF